jgi:hypothetical protein
VFGGDVILPSGTVEASKYAGRVPFPVAVVEDITQAQSII